MCTQTVAEAIKHLAHHLRVDRWNCPIVEGDKIAFVRVGYDHGTANPIDENKIYSFSRRHPNYIEQESFEALSEENQDFVFLSYFEHGQCVWDVASQDFTRKHRGTEFQWDGVRYAGSWVPSEDTRKMVEGEGLEVGSKERHERMAQLASGDCSTYTQWLNGEVYYYSCEVYTARKDADGEVWDELNDYRREPAISDDTCGGFYGWESLQEELKAIIQNLFS